MSLIDEALKRARQEAARQDEAARELRYRQVPVIPGLRQPARRSWLLPVVITACLIVGIGIGLGLSLTRGGGEDQRAAVPPPAKAPIAAPAPAQVEQIPAPPVPPAIEQKPEGKPAPVAVAPPVVPVQESAPVAAAPTPARPEAPTIAEMRQREIALNPAPRPQSAPPEARESEPAAPAPAPVPETPAPSAPEPAAPVAATEPGQVRTYQQEVPLAGGGTLRLNGIAFSEQPVALFGGKVVALGESVAGYKVVAIEARRVRLEGQGGVVVVEMP